MAPRASSIPWVRKADRVADDLLHRVVGGELTVGELLPTESELAAQHGVNRTVIREAIKLLEVHRLVHPVRRRGTEVLDPLASLSPEVLRAMLMPSPGKVDRHILNSLLEVRAGIDVQMSALAADRRTDAELALMDAHIARLGELLNDPDAYDAEAAELSLCIARATHNPLYEMLGHWNTRVMTDMQEIFRTIRAATVRHLQSLQTLVDLIRTQDRDRVVEVVGTFHQWATPRLLAAAALHSGESLAEAMGEMS